MIKSMTGFGQAVVDDGRIQVIAEIRCLNSKFLDLSARIPKAFSDKELEVRNLVSEKLERGKVSVLLEYTKTDDAVIQQTFNEQLFKAYYSELKRIADSVGGSHEKIFELALSSPDVIQTKIREDAGEEEWRKVRDCIIEAIRKCETFRIQEGKTLEAMLTECIRSIREKLDQVEALDPKRILRVREKLKGSVTSFFGEEGYDGNRLEQEIIFYIEKLDINEEKVRLKSHLEYFLSILKEPQSNGKKLAFISQEIGREINTIGSKANDAEIQKHVVDMKEELEKIKEQLSNVL